MGLFALGAVVSMGMSLPLAMYMNAVNAINKHR
jgi:hypothetical protein